MPARCTDRRNDKIWESVLWWVALMRQLIRRHHVLVLFVMHSVLHTAWFHSSQTTGRPGEPGWARSRERWGSSYFDRGLSRLWYEGRRRQPESPDAYSGWGEEPSGGASEAPAAQGIPGRRRRAAEPVAGHAPYPGPLQHRRRPEPAGRTPARLGPLAPRRPGAAIWTLGSRPTISA